jgi:predicted transcriptional regulator
MLANLTSNRYNGDMGSKRPSFSDELRSAVDASGMSRYRIAQLLGIAESTLSRFMSGERGLTMKCLDALAQLLDLHVAAAKKKG